MTRALSRGLAVLLATCGGWLVAARADEPADAQAAVQDFLFSGGDTCLFVRIHARVGERALPSAWRDAVAKLHAYLDTSAVGSVALNEELADFAEMIRGPLGVRTRPGSDSDQDTTFARLDANHDGALTPEETAQAAQVLLRFDRNDDEVLAASELASVRSASVEMAPTQQPSTPEPPVLVLDRSGSRIQLVQQVLGRFDKQSTRGGRSKDQKLSPAELPLPPAVFREFDADHDGMLDSFELMELLDRGTPSVELVLKLGTRQAQHCQLELAPQAEKAGESPQHAASGKYITVAAGGLAVDLCAEDVAWDLAQARKSCEILFDDLDFDDSKTLSASEARGREPFQGLFRLMDRDGDGQVTRDEMNAVLTLLEDLWRGHAVLSVKDRGARLFANLDTNGDGRLSVRELRRASAQVAAFDRNHDGKVTAAEIPHKSELSLSQAPPPPGLAVSRKAVPAADAPGAGPGAGPRWFQKMDRNHDGDLSMREFLGPRDQFLRLDADHDGLIDAHEAEAAGTPTP